MIPFQLFHEGGLLGGVRFLQLSQLLLNVHTDCAQDFIVLVRVFSSAHFAIKVATDLVAVLNFNRGVRWAEELFGVEVEIAADVKPVVALVILVELGELVEIGCRLHHLFTLGAAHRHSCLGHAGRAGVAHRLGRCGGLLRTELLGWLAFVHLERVGHALPQRRIVDVTEDATLDAVAENFIFFLLISDLRVSVRGTGRSLPCHDKIIEVFVFLGVELHVRVQVNRHLTLNIEARQSVESVAHVSWLLALHLLALVEIVVEACETSHALCHFCKKNCLNYSNFKPPS